MQDASSRVQRNSYALAVLNDYAESVAAQVVSTESAELLLAGTVNALSADGIIRRASDNSFDTGLLDHRRQRSLSDAPRLQDGGVVAAIARAGIAQFDDACAGLPLALAMDSACHSAHL